VFRLLIAQPANRNTRRRGTEQWNRNDDGQCKEHCQKHCMGNDTPTERANCLAREKCEDRATCPKTSMKFNSGAAGQKVKGPDAKANGQ
jgi:hypothetical protein